LSPKKEQKQLEKPEFLKKFEKENNFDIDTYLRETLGREPYVNNAKRRWRFLWSFSKFVFQRKEINFITVVRWFAKNAEVMKPRTIKESYIEYLETLGIIEWNENTKIVNWKGEEPNLD
jgi:hypothetical protein